MADSRLTAERLREVLHYDPETGIFVWRDGADAGSGGCRKRRPGVRAGCQDPSGYRLIWIDQCAYKEHRLAWFYVHGEWPDGQVDHMNGTRADNRIGNLRDVPQDINQQNRRAESRNRGAGLLGASLHPRSGKFQARIWDPVRGKSIYLGLFDTATEAHSVYLAKKRAIHPGCTI